MCILQETTQPCLLDDLTRALAFGIVNILPLPALSRASPQSSWPLEHALALRTSATGFPLFFCIKLFSAFATHQVASSNLKWTLDGSMLHSYSTSRGGTSRYWRLQSRSSSRGGIFLRRVWERTLLSAVPGRKCCWLMLCIIFSSIRATGSYSITNNTKVIKKTEDIFHSSQGNKAWTVNFCLQQLCL